MFVCVCNVCIYLSMHSKTKTYRNFTGGVDFMSSEIELMVNLLCFCFLGSMILFFFLWHCEILILLNNHSYSRWIYINLCVYMLLFIHSPAKTFRKPHWRIPFYASEVWFTFGFLGSGDLCLWQCGNRHLISGQNGEAVDVGPIRRAQVLGSEDSARPHELCGAVGLDFPWWRVSGGWDCVGRHGHAGLGLGLENWREGAHSEGPQVAGHRNCCR